MPEISQFEQSEDPLPNELGYSIPEEQMPGTLGELIVTDPRDPFAWKRSHNEKSSASAGFIMWAIYRRDVSQEGTNWRDQYLMSENLNMIAKRLSDYDFASIQRYQDFLAHYVEEPKTPPLALYSGDPQAQKQEASDANLHDPNIAHFLAAIWEHYDIINQPDEHTPRT